MSVSEHLDNAAQRLALAEARIQHARDRDGDPNRLRDWLDALTDYTLALSDLQRFANESIHEKLHELAGSRGASIGRPHEPPPAYP